MSSLPIGPPDPVSRWQRAFYVPLTILAWTAVVFVLGWLLGHVLHTLVMVLVAVILAFALSPVVAVLEIHLPRQIAIGGAYFLGIALIVGLGVLLIATAAGQVVNLVSNLPTYVQQIQVFEPRLAAILAPFGVTLSNLQATNQQILGALQGIGAVLAAGSLGFVGGFAGTLIDVVLTLMLSIYFTANGPKVAHWLEHDTPTRLHYHTRLGVRVTNRVVGGYIRGTLTMATLIGVLVGVGLTILGVPYAVLLGVLAFLMEFVPVIGVLISGAVSLMVALPEGPGKLLLVLGYFVIVHVIEGDVVGPRVVGNAVGIHPAISLIALLVGTELFGVWGALFASPVAGLLQATIIAAWREVTELSAVAATEPVVVVEPVPPPRDSAA
jgi:predicted PurR-regulated permease PerM